ncbi:structural maintenance of chromosomes flexible hinge domain-containing protein 1 isoform X2 [Sphaeramia orbicularis]|uniref:structural maintenance of chromosomes flexible hinge domain-containing protein 1 isoform X2 n=1 Tax=Sphaeramia orbicularis TaxID=375764 RepID=UPI00117F7B4E|nr:structural maintenance of chromosomes flexible hinge domain-containing protein 1 isoform X2 [Sphaeramia orbicularis]
MLSCSSSRPFASSADSRRNVCVYDCRPGNKTATKKWMETAGVDYKGFLHVLTKTFPDCSNKSFVLATTDRTILDSDKFMELEDGSTLYMLQQGNQALPVVTEEQIQFVPHYDTLICGGMYEYYASEGQTALSYTLAELIDNALSATAKNTGKRIIEIRMLFDESQGKPAIIVLDNGCGMTSKKLNKWAVYRLSKFNAEGSSNGESNEERYVRPDPVPRSLNSDISYFGVGGKQAVFYIGESARMISKSVTSPDVHELVLSKEDFERKVKNKEDVYSGTIINRKPGDFSRVPKEEEHFLRSLIAEETGKESFTAVVITEVKPEHITLLKQDFQVWTRQLAHTYHYYIHGVNGNDLRSSSTKSHDPKIDIEITLQEKITKCPRVLNLREVDNDMQTLYINAAADTFEFKALTQPDGGIVEGVLRYHPYLYDRETYPEDPDAPYAPIEDDDVDEETGLLQPIKKKPIFECFWNGRLIPYTTVAELDWCARPSKGAKVPVECYNRISGVLFTDDRFQVTTNKLTFMELELKLRNKETIFSCSVNGQRGQRGNIQRDFTQWLQNCHEKWDKQVKFLNYKETITRTDVPTKKMQHPWAIFSSIEWDSREYRIGQFVKSQKTQPIIYGTVVRFLLHGNYDGDVFATGGLVEVCLEPKALYNKTKIMPISKLDKNATHKAIKANIESDLAKLPQKLKVDWPEGKPWPQNATRPAGTQFGPLQVEILNGNQESLSRMPLVGTVIKLIVELKVVRHRPDGDEEVASCVAQYAASWRYWFKKIANLVKLGKYTLRLNTMISETNETVFGDRQLPFFTLRFTIKEGSAEKFDLGTVSSTLHVGVPFDIPLKIKDAYGHSTAPPPDVKPVLKCSGLELTYEKVQSSKDVFIIQNVKARGKVQNYQQSKTYDLKVILPGLKEDTKSFQINLLPGNPHSIHVTPEDAPITVENGNTVQFDVAIHDEAGNITAHHKLIARCQIPGLQTIYIDCSRTGVGQHVTKPIKVKIVGGEPQTLKVQFDVPNHLSIASVTRELRVEPSSRVCRMEVCCHNCHNNDILVLKNNERIEWQAGGTLENLFYRLYDEGNRKVDITPAIASKIKVNWTSDGNVKDLSEGELPDVHVPTQVQEERFYQVSYQDQSISVSFSIVPHPNEPSRLKATLSQNTARLGEPMSGNIILDLVDQYENVTKTLTSTCVNCITVEAEGLNKSALVLTWQESSCSVLVTGVCFQSGTLGPREMSFTFRSYVDQVMVKVTAGVPAQLKLVSGPTQPLQVLNNHSIPTPFLVQLCDKWGNPSRDQRVVVHLKSSQQALKVAANVTSQPMNAEGKASFIVTSVCGPKGYYQLAFEGSLNSKPLHGPLVNLTVMPDPNKPVSLSVTYDTNAVLPAGGVFPVFSVTVVSEEGSPVTVFNKAAADMRLWKGVHSRRPREEGKLMKCNEPMENEEKHCIHFRNKDIPEQLGKHTIQFSLIDREKELQSNLIIIDVVANDPVQLRPDVQPATPVVSYSTEVANRTLVDGLTLTIVDQYGNPAGQNLNGKVLVSIESSNGGYNSSLPLFEGRTRSRQFVLLDGKAHISKLTIMENSPGENGSIYILHFEPVLQMASMSLASFELPFHFYNDSKNQQRMSELSKKKDELKHIINVHQDFFNSRNEYKDLLTTKYNSACTTEATQREELNRMNLNIPQTVSTQAIDGLITEKRNEAERISRLPRRQCSIRDPFQGQQDVLGKVGHLALVVEDDAAWVISWHISRSMDCVITMTTAAAQMIYRNTGGRQQVMALDSVYVSGGRRPLPHIRNGRALFDPPGNPVFARDRLIFPNHQESCDIVFRNLLGDTILMDDLDSANHYRRTLVQNHTSCPTILTRQGDRIGANAIWGGSQNRAPSPQGLNMFAAPIPQQYFSLQEQIGLLMRYRSALQNRESTKLKCEQVLAEEDTLIVKKREMEEKMAELKEVEEQLASTSVRALKRVSMDAAGPSGLSKRPRSTSK